MENLVAGKVNQVVNPELVKSQPDPVIVKAQALQASNNETPKRGRGRPAGTKTAASIEKELAYKLQQIEKLEARKLRLLEEISLVETKINEWQAK